MPDKERINYTISEGKYIAHFVNFPIVIECDSYEDMLPKCREMLKVLQKRLNELYRYPEQLEFVEQESFIPKSE